ncbi:MAG: membrane protein insertase YidC, partial [Acidobacteriales bacterium]|nr:membrane protein insertase YidC [Terriglobales bacterium]
MSDYQSGFQNPQEDPGNSQRLLIAFALIFVVIVASQWLIGKYGPKQEPAAPKSPAASAPANAAAPAPQTPSSGAPSQATATSNAPQSVPQNQAKQAASESETVVENNLYRVTFTNRGGAVTHWVLKNQPDDRGQPLDLVHAEGARFGLPLSVYTYDTTLNEKLRSALFVANLQGAQTAALATDKTGKAQAEQIREAQQDGDAGQTLTFEYSDAETRVTKTFRFDQTYVVHADVVVWNKGAATTALLAWPAGFGDQASPSAYSHSNIAYDTGSSVTRVGTSKSFFGRGNMASNGASVQGPLAWAGPEDQYFAAVFLPDHPDTAQLVTFSNSIPQDAKNPGNGKTYPLLGAAVGNTNGSTSLRVFVGPKLLRVLSSVHAADGKQAANANSYSGPTLDNMLDFGFFGFIAKPLFLWLRWTYEHIVPNWGWAILIVTVIINVVLLPIRLKQIRSSMRMMRIQPQVDAINRKYQGVKFSDTEKMQAKNAEIQDLYKREGINPVGGCIPVFMQLPILWAFFKVLEITVELRHAPWLWVHDLSAPDPLHLLPIALFVSMILLQNMTPTPGVDPVQAKMMKYTMPLM